MRTIDKFINRILLGDCVQVMGQMPSETIDLILYADERQKLDVLVPPEVYKGALDEEDEDLS
jgi:hypothetical protein